MNRMPESWVATLISLLIVGLVLALRFRAMGRTRRLRVERLWILPCFYALLVGVIFWTHPPHGMTWLYALLGLATGAGLGWYRGKLMRIHVDPQTHELSQQSSPAAILLIVGLVLVRSIGRRLALAGGGGGPEAIFAATDILLAFALGFLALQRIEMGLRARKLLLEARRARP